MRGPRAENASDLQQSRLYRPDGPGIVGPVSRRRQTVRSQLCQMSYLDTAQTYEAVGARRSSWYALQSTCAFATSTKFASSIAATVAPMAIRHVATTPLSCDCFTISIPVKMVPRALSHRASSARCSPSLPRHTPCRPNATGRIIPSPPCPRPSSVTESVVLPPDFGDASLDHKLRRHRSMRNRSTVP